MPGHWTEMKLPPWWAEDPLSDFINGAFKHVLVTFVQKQRAFDHLLRIELAFAKIGKNLDYTQSPLAPTLLHRSHSAFLASCRLAMSGQAAETFPLLRSTLEYALYALHVHENPALVDVWSRRHDDEKSRREVGRQFQYARVAETLRECDPTLHRDISRLYEQAIDFGGHPNERAVSSSAVITREGDTEVIRNYLLHGDSWVLDHALRATAQVGLGSLMVFRLILREQFALPGLSDTIDALRRELYPSMA